MTTLTDTTAWWERTDTWTTREGETIALENLTPSHRENIIAFIRRHGEAIRFRMSWRYAIDLALHDGGEQAHDGIEAEAEWVDEAPLDEFIESLPLVKRLRELEPKVIVRVNSHRAREKMLRLGVRHTGLGSFDFDGDFYEVPERDAQAVLAITGITRARRQDRSVYFVRWKMGVRR